MRSIVRSSETARRLGITLGVVGAISTAAVAAASPAAADPVDSYISSNSGGANMRTCASTDCGAIAYLSNGTAVYMLCYTDGQNATGNYTSTRWFKVGLHYDNRAGFVHSSLVTQQTSVGRCP